MAEGENKMYKVNTVYLLGLAPFSLLSDIEKLLALIKHRVYKRLISSFAIGKRYTEKWN